MPPLKNTEEVALAKGQELIKLMGEEGYTLTAACARLGIHRASFVDRLSERYPAFKELVEQAQALRQAYLEEQLLRYVRAEVRGSPAAAIFALVNCNKKVGDWNQPSNATVIPRETPIDLSKYTEEELVQLQKLIDKETGVTEIELNPTSNTRAIKRRT